MEFIFVKIKSGTYCKIKIQDIIYIKSDGDYLEIHLKDKRFVHHLSLEKFSKILNDKFFRCHRCFIVNIDKIDKLEDDTLICDGKLVTLAKANKTELLKKLNCI